MYGQDSYDETKLTATYKNGTCTIRKPSSLSNLDCEYKTHWKGPKCHWVKKESWFGEVDALKCDDMYGYDLTNGWGMTSWKKRSCEQLLNNNNGFGSHQPK